MSIPAIPAIGAGVSPVSPAAYLSGVSGVAGPSGVAASGSGFAAALGSVDQLQQMQSNTDSLAVQAVTGSLTDAHDYTIAAAQTQLTMDLTSAVRNQAVSAFNQIMSMQA
jgi:flagellar hook-basal body complex protein FliE